MKFKLLDIILETFQKNVSLPLNIFKFKTETIILCVKKLIKTKSLKKHLRS